MDYFKIKNGTQKLSKAKCNEGKEFRKWERKQWDLKANCLQALTTYLEAQQMLTKLMNRDQLGVGGSKYLSHHTMTMTIDLFLDHRKSSLVQRVLVLTNQWETSHQAQSKILERLLIKERKLRFFRSRKKTIHTIIKTQCLQNQGIQVKKVDFYEESKGKSMIQKLRLKNRERKWGSDERKKIN